jgi:hypothetical protein
MSVKFFCEGDGVDREPKFGCLFMKMGVQVRALRRMSPQEPNQDVVIIVMFEEIVAVGLGLTIGSCEKDAGFCDGIETQFGLMADAVGQVPSFSHDVAHIPQKGPSDTLSCLGIEPDFVGPDQVARKALGFQVRTEFDNAGGFAARHDVLLVNG